jgi:type I restriction enzyme, S subunit
MPDPLGRACIFPGDPKPSVTVVDVCIIRPDGEHDARWLMHCLNAPLCRNQIATFATGTTRSRISRGNLAKIKIPLPPLKEQQRIAGILDKAEALRAKRRAALAKIDVLPQAIFLELFGRMDKVNSAALSDVANLKRGPFGGTLKKEIFVESGYKVYEQKNAIRSDFTIGQYFITEAKYREMEDFAIKPNDLIVSCSGTLGKVAIVPQTAPPGVINQALLRVRPDRARITSLFLKHALEQRTVQARLAGFSHGTGLQNFPPMSEVRALAIPAPSISSQHEFARRVEAVEKLKGTQRASLAKLDALFASLQHRAFRGEL